MFPHIVLDQRPLAVVDLETTALAPSVARIIDIAVLKLRPDDRPQRFTVRLDPGVPIPPSATEVHGIRNCDVRGKPSFARMAPLLAGLLQDADLLGFNLVNFDLPVLAAEFRRAGVPFALAGRAVVDVFALFKRQEPRDLSAAVKFYLGRAHDRAHTAAADVWATAAVFDAQLARYPELPTRAAELHELLVEVDIGRRFRRGPDGRAVMGFGKYAGVPLAEVAGRDPDYLHWVLRTDLLDDAAALIRRALAGLSPEAADSDFIP